MSSEALAIALHHSRAKGTTKLVLIGIANHDGDGGAWPAVATLARYANVDERSVQRSLRELEHLGEIRTMKHGGGSPQTPAYRRPNLYHFLLSCPPHCDNSRQHRDTRRSARYVPNYLMGLEEDGWESGATLASPGDTGVTPPVTDVSPHPVTPASPELDLRTTHKPSSGSVPDAGARVPSADEWAAEIDRAHGGRGLMPRPISALERCPARSLGPCAIHPRTHVCMDCLCAAVPWAQPGSNTAEDDRRVAA